MQHEPRQAPKPGQAPLAARPAPVAPASEVSGPARPLVASAARADALGGQLARAVARRGEGSVASEAPQAAGVQVLQRQFDVASQTRDWSDLTTIKRSSGGLTSGVLFADDSQGNRLVVKFITDGAGPTFADALIGLLGISTPASRVLDKAETKIAKKALKSRRADLANKQQHKELDKLSKLPYVQVQEFANATPFDKLTTQDRLLLVADRHSMRTVGKLAMADAFMANSDRVTRTQCNLGNLMLAPDGTVLAIDNDARFDPGSTEPALEDIDYLLDPAGAKGLSSTFLAGMLRHMSPTDAMKVDFDAIERWIGEGIMEGAVEVSDQVTPTVMAEAENLEFLNWPAEKKKNRRMRAEEMHKRLVRIRERGLALIG